MSQSWRRRRLIVVSAAAAADDAFRWRFVSLQCARQQKTDSSATRSPVFAYWRRLGPARPLSVVTVSQFIERCRHVIFAGARSGIAQSPGSQSAKACCRENEIKPRAANKRTRAGGRHWFRPTDEHRWSLWQSVSRFLTAHQHVKGHFVPRSVVPMTSFSKLTSGCTSRRRDGEQTVCKGHRQTSPPATIPFSSSNLID